MSEEEEDDDNADHDDTGSDVEYKITSSQTKTRNPPNIVGKKLKKNILSRLEASLPCPK